MRTQLQFVRWMLCVALCGVVSLQCVAQKNHSAPPPPPPRQNHPQYRQQQPPKQQNQPKANPNRPPANQERPAGQTPNANRPNPGAGAAGTGANNAAGRNLTPRQQLGVGAPRPWLQTMRELPPAQRERFFQNSPAFRNLPPDRQNKIRQQFNHWDHLTAQQKADQLAKERNWESLSQEQRNHIKNDVLPTWREMPQDRRQAIQQRLRVLQNMPESARNQRLNDPKFTEGMSDEDKSMLRDLSHLHQGGAPDPPGE